MGEREEKGHDGCSSVLAVVAIVILFFLVFVNAPGAALLALIVDYCHISLDVGQYWTFSLVISLLVYILLNLSLKDSVTHYVGLCFAVLILYLVAHFGLHLGFAMRHYHYLIPA